MKLLQGYLHSLPSCGFSSHVNYLATFHFNPPLSFSTKEIIWFLHWRYSADSCPLSRKQCAFTGFTCAWYFSFFLWSSYCCLFFICSFRGLLGWEEKFRHPKFFPCPLAGINLDMPDWEETEPYRIFFWGGRNREESAILGSWTSS